MKRSTVKEKINKAVDDALDLVEQVQPDKVIITLHCNQGGVRDVHLEAPLKRAGYMKESSDG